MSTSVLARAAFALAIVWAGLFSSLHVFAGVLDTSPHAYTGTPNPLGGAWQGEEFLGSSFGSALIDWAVFTSSDYQLFLNDIGSSAANPALPGEFVYAYQLTNISSFFGVSAVTVGLDGDETISGPDAPNASWLDTTEFTANHYPFIGSNQGGTSMAWQWTPLAGSGSTTILYFVSPNLPELDNATMPQIVPAEVLGVIGSPSNQLIPEPATCGLALSALALLAPVRRFRR